MMIFCQDIISCLASSRVGTVKKCASGSKTALKQRKGTSISIWDVHMLYQCSNVKELTCEQLLTSKFTLFLPCMQRSFTNSSVYSVTGMQGLAQVPISNRYKCWLHPQHCKSSVSKAKQGHMQEPTQALTVTLP